MCIFLSPPLTFVCEQVQRLPPSKGLSQHKDQLKANHGLEKPEDGLSALLCTLQTLKNMLIILYANVIMDTR